MSKAFLCQSDSTSPHNIRKGKGNPEYYLLHCLEYTDLPKATEKGGGEDFHNITHKSTF